MRNGYSLRILLAGVAATILAGCGTSPPARNYTLDSIGPQEMSPAGRQAANPLSVSIEPVELPDYLDRPQIVTRTGDNGLEFAEYDRWGGSLGDNITTVLVENLSRLLGSDKVYASPWLRPEKPDFRVAVRILRLDFLPGDRVELMAQWLVMPVQEKQAATRGISTFTEPVTDGNYATLVAAASRTIEQLSHEIAREMSVQKKNLSGTLPEPVRP